MPSSVSRRTVTNRLFERAYAGPPASGSSTGKRTIREVMLLILIYVLSFAVGKIS